ncbi:hypothetical protein [Plantibacter sp. YIM 135249]|uniref:hypothetical protein n=1 Tax=Plantibacter sp. YIM 135249 TaxID=3423918 RepID=UPI003D32B687
MRTSIHTSPAEDISGSGRLRRLLRGAIAARREAATLLATNAIIGPLVAMLPLSVLLSTLGVGPRGTYPELDRVGVLSHQGSSFTIGCVLFAVVGVLAVAADGERTRRAEDGGASRPNGVRSVRLVAWAGLVWADGFLAAVLSAIAPLGIGGAFPPDTVWLVMMTAVGTGSGWAAFAVIAFCIGVMARLRPLGIAVSLLLTIVVPVVVESAFRPSGVADYLPMSAARAVAAPGISESPAHGALVLGAWVVAAVMLAWCVRRRSVVGR